jgi:hypothetical protein
MGKIILEFDSFEEKEDAQNALNGWKYKALLWELDQKLRSVHKYGGSLDKAGEATEEERDICYRVRDVIRQMLRESNLDIES